MIYTDSLCGCPYGLYSEKKEGNNLKKFIAATVAALMTAGTVIPSFAAETAFTDVDKSTSVGQSIYKLSDAGIVNGYTDNTFRPNGELTRAELCKMVNLVFDYKESTNNIFVDVLPNSWYYVQVLTAIKYGYIKGYDDGTFKGDNHLTREQFCVILDRIVDKKADSEAEISDDISEWAKDSVKNIVALGYMSAEDGNKFRATQNITRGELAEVLAKFVKDAPAQEVKPSDDKKDGTTSGENDKNDGKDNNGTTDTDKPSDNNNGGNSGNSGNGGNSGNSGNTGDTDPDPDPDPEPTPDPTPEPTPEKVLSDADAAKLKDAYNDIYACYNGDDIGFVALEFTIDKEMSEQILDTLLADMNVIIEESDTNKSISPKYIRNKFADDITLINQTIEKMSAEGKAEFKNKLATIPTMNTVSFLKTFLSEYFGITITE